MNLSSVRIALRGIVANKMRSFLTTLGILIGVASVILVVAVGAGSAAATRANLEALGSNTLTVRTGGFGFGARAGTQSTTVSITNADVTALSDKNQAPDVAQVVPSVNVSNETVVYNGATDTPSTFSGTTTNFSTVRNYPAQSGTWFTQQEYDNHADVIVLGLTDVKNLLGAQATGSEIVGQKVLIGGKSFTVIGVFASKGSNGFQDQDSIAIMPLTTARDEFVGNSGTVDGLTVQATSSKTAAAAQSEISAVLVARHPGSSTTDFSVLNQQSLLQTVSSNNRTFTVLLAAVAAISLLVGGIGVMNIMLVTVTERTREIGIRKAVGARQGHILTQFLVEAVLLAGIGGIVGAGSAIVLSGIVTIQNVTPLVEPYSVFLALGFAVATGLFFGIYPANRAAKLRPIDALRYE
ncbi:MAG: putative transport system permease protein [Actinomycetota bacterium]|nr:putative transport system permease protein [Actinomycetota bacterium]